VLAQLAAIDAAVSRIVLAVDAFAQAEAEQQLEDPGSI